VTDLTRLVAKFGVALITVPSAIHFLIPPLCPTTSAIFKQSGSSPDGLVLNGVKKATWEDCISWTDFNHSATSLASGDKAFAIGLITGNIEIYNQGSCQWERTIQHHEHIDILKFEHSGHFLASCGTRSIKLWDTNGSELWTRRLKSRCIELAFHASSLVGVSTNGHVTTWNLKTGEIVGEPHRFLYKESDDESGKPQVRAPSTASISPAFQMIALGTRKAYVCLWSLQDSDVIGWCSIPDADSVALVLFNPNPNIGILAVGYNTSRLAIFDPWSQDMIQSTKTGNGHQQVASLASSPDGRTLASVDSCGTMQLWDFETLTLLYQVKSTDLGFRIVEFNWNWQRILDLMDSKLRVWEPAGLIRKTSEENVSVSDTDESKARQGITAMVCHPTVSVILVGKYNGSVAAHASKSGKEVVVLYMHPEGIFVTAIAVSLHDILASGDVNGNVQVWQLKRSPTLGLKTDSLLLMTSAGKAVQQLLISPAGDFVLVSIATSYSILSIQTGTCIVNLDNPTSDRNVWKWLVGTDTRSELLLIFDNKFLRYNWDNLPNLLGPQVLTLPPECQQLMQETTIKSAILDAGSQNIIIDLQQDGHEVVTKALLILSVGTILSSPLTTQSSTTPIVLATNPALLNLCDYVKYFLGLSGNRLLFIDNASWLSSVDLKMGTTTGPRGEYTRHFFAPNEFVAKETGILPMLSPDKDVIFAVEGELAIIRNGLKFHHVTRVGEIKRERSYGSGMDKK
jgi:WD40 repeat protein